MRSDELYKSSDGTLTRLRTSLEDITKNIHMEYLPKRRWSTLEKKRANIMIKNIKDGYGYGEVTIYPTQIFNVNNWALKPNQPEGPPFTAHMMAICNAEKPVAFKAPKSSSNAERVPQGTKPGAKPRHKKNSTSLKQPRVSSSEVTKGGSSKAPIGFKIGHSKKIKEYSSAMDSNPSQILASTPVVAEMHKEDQQATGGPTSLGVTSKARANPLSSVVGMDEGTKNSSFDHIYAVKEEEAFNTIKLEDLAKLVSNVQPSFKDLDSPEDDLVIVVDDGDKNKEDKALKPNQPEGPPFTAHMIAICNAEKPVVFKALKSSSNAERVPQGTKPGAKPGHKKNSTSLKQPRVSSSELCHGLKPKPDFSFYSVVAEMHKEDQQATGGPTSLGVTSKARANLQLSSSMLAFNLNEHIYSASFIIHSESASGYDALADSTAKADPGLSAPNDSIT
nr:hypothetical protein [Tanacetum cinerariifolium]